MTQKPRTYNGDLANLPAALAPLTEQRRWVNWSWDWRARKNGGGKWTKPPRQAHAPEQFAKSDDPATWGTYEQALDNVTAGRANGIGFALKGSNIGAIDIDHCVDPREDKLVSWAEQLHEEAAYAYQEVTVSGGGLRIIGTADGPEIHRKFTFDRKTGAGIELYRNTARYITVSGLEMGSCAALPPLDEFIDRLIARHTGQARDGLDFNHAAPQTFNNYDDIIRNGAPQGERSELFQAVIWHFAGKGRTAEEITDELAQYPNGIAAKYADRLHDEVTRSYEKWRAGARSRATGSVADGSAHPWPQIFVTPGELPRVVNEAEDALLALNREIYQRGGMIVRPVLSDLKAADNRDTQGWRLIPMTRPHLVETLTRAARFLKYDGRSKDWVAIDAPDKIADAYLARQGAWKLPRLSGIINTPFIRIDGSVCEKLGYDHASELLFKSDGQDFPPIPQHPGKADALEALKAVVSLISSFPFVSDADRSTALSAIFTAIDRRSMATAPLHAFTAPVAGSGKSLLVDIIAMLATGRPMPVIAQGKNEEELEKRLASALLAGDAAISIDNVEHPLQSSFLCQALTQAQLNIRLLGLSKNVETPVNAAIYATGNNLTIGGDLTRRCLLCSLDAQCERPELRSFDHDVVGEVRANRSKLVAAILTVLRAWQIACQRERVTLPPFGSFETWSRRIREPLVWLGHPDPCETVLKVRSSDPHRAALETVLVQWHENLGSGTYTVQQVISRAVVVADFQAALCAVAGSQSGIVVVADRLGRWMKKVQGQIVNGLVLIPAGSHAGYQRWQVNTVKSL